MTEMFKFTEATRRQLHAALMRLWKVTKADIEAFILAAENDVHQWHCDCPPAASAADRRTARRRLGNLDKHVSALLFELRALPGDAQQTLALQMLKEHSRAPRLPARPDQAANHLLAETEYFLETFRMAIHAEIGRRANGYDEHRKLDLARRISLSYCHAFGDTPRRTPDSPFMESVAVIGAAVGLTIGKDNAGDGLDLGVERYNWHLRTFGLTDI